MCPQPKIKAPKPTPAPPPPAPVLKQSAPDATKAQKRQSAKKNTGTKGYRSQLQIPVKSGGLNTPL